MFVRTTAAADSRAERRRRHATCLAAIVLLFHSVAPLVAAADTPQAIRTLVDTGERPYRQSRNLAEVRETLQQLYAARQHEPLWLNAGRPSEQAKAVVRALAQSDSHGLVPANYDAELLRTQEAELEGTPATSPPAATFDVALSASTIRFASDLHRGRIDPNRVGLKRLFPAKELDLPRVVGEVATAADAEGSLAALAPRFPAYVRLRETLAQVRGLAARSDLPVVPELPKWIFCDAPAGLAPVRELLRIFGDLPADALSPPDPNVYDESLSGAVMSFQKRHGLEVDGILGPATLRQLRMPMAKRVEQVRLGLERLRWLPEELPQRSIIVNIPEFRLRAYEPGNLEPELTMDVVVGSAARKNETPLLHASMRRVIFRPRWNVPASITHKEMLPEILEDPGAYFKRQNLEIVDRSGLPVPVTLANIEEISRGGARLRQRPGSRNSLGLIKFEFPNSDNIYFHDTPSKTLFRRSRRDFSHGCVRVSDPVGLAEYALQGVDNWNQSRIAAAMRSTDPRKIDVRVPVKSPIAVYLWYTTVASSDDGSVVFLDDIYGYDAKLAPLLARDTQRAES